MIISGAIGVICVALLARGVNSLDAAKSDVVRAAQEAKLDGFQALAAEALEQSDGPGPFRWALESTFGSVAAEAEPEQTKLSFESLQAGNDRIFAALGVQDLARARANLSSGKHGWSDLEKADPAPAWRHCAASLASPFGRSTVPPNLTYSAPSPGSAERGGAVWRIRLRSREGWVDDRLVRFVGLPGRPTETIERKFYYSNHEPIRCDALFPKSG